jgi:hypothetical protein
MHFAHIFSDRERAILKARYVEYLKAADIIREIHGLPETVQVSPDLKGFVAPFAAVGQQLTPQEPSPENAPRMVTVNLPTNEGSDA